MVASNYSPADDSGYEADGLELFVHTSVTRIEYYRSFEYSLKWSGPMSPRRSSRLSKGSTKSPRRSPSPKKDVIQPRLSSKRPKAGQRETKAVDNIVDADEGSVRDIIDIINSTNDAKHVAEEDGGELLKVVDEGVDHSDEDCYSVTSSVASGPSLKRRSSPKKHSPLQGVCSACRKLYQKAKKMKAPIKNKLLDNNPKSLTCDQWVLLKKWTPRRLPNARGKLLAHIQLVSERLMVKNGAKQTEQCVEPSTCWRQHAFLQRNLRKNINAPVKNQRKKNRRKRTRDDSQGPRVAKQQRINSNNHCQHISMDCTHDDSLLTASVHSSSPDSKVYKEQKSDDSADTYLTVELIPTSVSLETTKPRRASPKQKTPKKARGFRDLLAQLRGNSSMIVRESR
ncbi:hypothetical protein GBF38_016159 [Nibea albiflora]|uniref:Uncharacterized protein n=1 Tax=Nibea albiflora TaxID=240163 RepID=A0ACB7FHM5_NIBAL|nr:hypothetical protein GBF38_016159 [Nibea albiflora]